MIDVMDMDRSEELSVLKDILRETESRYFSETKKWNDPEKRTPEMDAMLRGIARRMVALGRAMDLVMRAPEAHS